MAKSIVLKVLFFLFGCLFAFMIGELLLRQMGYAGSDIYTQGKNGLLILNPDKEIRIRSSCFSNLVKTNELGFHAKNYSIEKPDDIFRIAILGDSFVEATQVPLDKNFAFLLEEKLNSMEKREHEFEVIPFGISSHGTYRNIFYYENYASGFHPDLIINALVWNDIEDDAWEADINFDDEGKLTSKLNIYNDQSLSKQIKKILRKSVLITTLRKKLAELKTNPETSFKETDPGILSLEYNDFWEDAWNLQEKLLLNLKNKVNEDGSRLLLVSLSDGYRVHRELEERFISTIGDKAIDQEKPERLLGQIADNNQIDYIALNPIFKEKAKTESSLTVWSCDGHWNETGHEWAAQALFEYIKNSKLIQNE